jgi:hypothetical protein
MDKDVKLDCRMCGLKILHDQPINEVWSVITDDPDEAPILWRTKTDAEIYARRKYPDESPDKRYARIYYEKILSYDYQYLDEGDDNES